MRQLKLQVLGSTKTSSQVHADAVFQQKTFLLIRNHLTKEGTDHRILKKLIKGKEAKITSSWSDNPNKAGVAVESIQIGDKVWRREGRKGSKTQK